MRRRITLLATIITAAIVLAFLVPIIVLLRTVVADRALGASAERAGSVLAMGLASTSDNLRENVPNYLKSNQGPAGTETILRLQNGETLGLPRHDDDPGWEQAFTTQQPFTRRDGDVTITYRAGRSDLGIMVARDQVQNSLLTSGVWRDIVLVAAMALVLLGLAVYAVSRLARRITEPIQEVAMAADAMQEGSLDIRVPERGLPEVVTLGRALNRLADRVGRLLTAERDAVADLSHRLRTPVTALRLDTEMITDAELGERLREHITQLERTVDAIVHDARRPSRNAGRGTCDAAKIVRQRVAFWSALAEEQDRPLRTAVPERPMLANVSTHDLTDVVDVLLDNVFAHTDDGVPIEVWLVPRADGAIVLTVEDGGTGLPAGDIVSRGSSGAGSSGLGLDIARRTAMASGGWLELGQSRLGGALVRVVLGRAEAL